MKKMVIFMPKLSVGGMEKSLINFLNKSNVLKKYEVTLYLGYCVDSSYLDSIPKDVKIVLLHSGAFNKFGKLKVGIKLFYLYLKFSFIRKKYDVSISYAYQHGILATLTRKCSNNSIIFIHSNLLSSRNSKELTKLMHKVKYDKFSKVVCVSNDSKNAFEKIYPNYTGKVEVINNYIDGEKIIVNSKLEKIEKSSKVRFINISRHEEKSKKITRIINSSLKLSQMGYDFEVFLIGDGQDHDLYKELIRKNNLEKYVKLLGRKINPYPYLKSSDCLVVSSEYEGYCIVFDEARILNVPFVSTDIADAKLISKQGYGMVFENSENGVFDGMKKFLDEGYAIKKEFDYKKFENKITEKIDKLIG